MLSDGWALIGNRKSLDASDDVFVFSNFSVIVKFLARLGVIKYRRSICYGFFVHSPRWFPLFRLLAMLDTERDHYLIFTAKEIWLYSLKLGLNAKNLHPLPYGDWQREIRPELLPPIQMIRGYYFAGGYTNRDYGSLISAFRNRSEMLIIACAHLNTEIPDLLMVPNIIVLRDIPRDKFEAYVRGAKACIAPLKHDTGASGQSMILQCLRNGKAVIASDKDAVRPYVIDGKTGYLVRDMKRMLPNIISRIEADPTLADTLGQAGYQHYKENFSRAAIVRSFDQIVREIMERS